MEEQLKAEYSRIPDHLRIQVLYKDSDIVVINKPHNLRSVPGHASTLFPTASIIDREKDDKNNKNNSNNNHKKRKRPSSVGDDNNEHDLYQRTSQEAWVEAIRHLSSTAQADQDSGSDVWTTPEETKVRTYLQRLGENPARIVSIPRKFAPFTRYLQRNKKRILDPNDCAGEKVDDSIVRSLFQRVEKYQKRFMNYPKSTNNCESALGQLKLLGLAKSIPGGGGVDGSHDNSRMDHDMFVVHRLDCETSGVMVFARSSQSASVLSAAWRERKTTKVYHALVPSWTLSQVNQETMGKIDVPLLPHPSERLKWIVGTTTTDSIMRKDTAEAMTLNNAPDTNNNTRLEPPKEKPSITLWRFCSENDKGILLELTPVTGRTHQLRVHCAHMGSPIVGDSLYGSKSGGGGRSEEITRLYLHAYKLTFPHPTLGRDMTFTVDPNWSL